MTDNLSVYHIPVLLQESIQGLNINPCGVYIDLTFGGGGHSREILKHLSCEGRLFAFDKDKDAENNRIDDGRFCLIRDDYRNFVADLALYRIKQVDGILADLGISSHQIDTPERGFSYKSDSPLDMRMNKDGKLTGADVINYYSEEKLSKLFYDYGELQNAKKIARLICNKRQIKPIETTFELQQALKEFLPFKQREKFLSQIFQALRIEVNGELDSLDRMLTNTAEILKPNGRLVIISYHSLEDRLVKNLIKTGNTSGKIEKDFYGNAKTPFAVITKKPIIPKEQEISRNTRARSAKLRIAEKIN